MIKNVTKTVIKMPKSVVGSRIRIFLSKMDQKSQKSLPSIAFCAIEEKYGLNFASFW